MHDNPIRQTTIRLQSSPTPEGFSVLAINAGIAKGHDLEFSPQVLKESLSLWDNVPCMLDHPGLFEGPSVRDLAGSLHSPTWNEAEQGIQAHLLPAGPGADVLASLRASAFDDLAIMQAVGLSAVVRISVKGDVGARQGDRRAQSVERILQVASVDCVINPTRGGKFLSALHDQTIRLSDYQTHQGVPMSDESTPTPSPSLPEMNSMPPTNCSTRRSAWNSANRPRSNPCSICTYRIAARI